MTELVSNPTKHKSIILPDWCYEDDVCLIDIQNNKVSNELLYIFRDKDGNKKYHRERHDNNYYYTTKREIKNDIGNDPMLIPINEAKYNSGFDHDQHSIHENKYESDVKSELRHSIDYRYLRTKPECDVDIKILYADIEIYNYGQKGHDDIKNTSRPINAISFKVPGQPTNVYVTRLPEMDQTPYIVPDNTVVSVFDSEKETLEEFAKVVRDYNPDIITGWNFLGFDIVTIFGRMRKNGLDFSIMSPLKMSFSDINKYGQFYLYGLHILDMMELYKEFTYNVEESYSLNYISQKVLKSGKVAYTGSLDGLYEKDLSKFLEYSSVDTSLLEQLNDKLKHIDLKFELIRICSTTWKNAETTTGLIDPLCLSYAKNIGLLCRTAKLTSGKSIIGAYVRKPVAGIYGYMIDLDFTSLYPSIIISFNIGPNTYVLKIPPDIAYQIIYYRDVIDRNAEIDVVMNPITNISKTSIKMKIGDFINYMDKHKLILSSAGTVFKNHSSEISFFTKILQYLMGSRKDYKNMMNDAKRSNEDSNFLRFKNIQLAYKILANSLYGVLANSGFRFYNPDMAESITMTGRDAVKFSGYHAGKYLKTNSKDIDNDFDNNYDEKELPYIVYQDTDSIFIDLGSFLIDKGVLDLNGKMKTKKVAN